MPTVLVTGANRGIGLALAQAYASRGDAVIAACRASSPELEASGARVEAGVDVTDDASLRALSARLGDTAIDVLVCNAGVLGDERFGALDAAAFDGMRRQYEVNALGPLRTIEALAGHLRAGAKVGIVTSRMGSMADNGSGGHYGYRASKAAVNAIGVSLAHELAPRGVSVFLLHPGYVVTDMTGGRGEVVPAQSAAGLIERLDSLGPGQSGTFWHANGTPLPW